MGADHPNGLVPDLCLPVDPCPGRVAAAEHGDRLYWAIETWWRWRMGWREPVTACPWCGRHLEAHSQPETLAGVGTPEAVGRDAPAAASGDADALGLGGGGR